MPKRITSAVLKALQPGDSVRSSTLQGFVARRHRDGKISYEVRRQGAHPLHRVIARGDLVSLPQAEDAARKTLAQHVLARNTEAGKRFTFDRAWPLYKAHLLSKGEKRSPQTITTYEKSLARLTAAVRKTSLRALADDPSILAAEHQRIAATRPPAADATMRICSALYNFIARRHDKTLPAMNPTIDIDLTIKDAVGGGPTLSIETAPDWARKVQALKDPLRRLAHLFLLLSGLRPDSLCDMKWSDQVPGQPWQYNIERKVKGGRRRAFVLICSDPMVRCLQQCKLAAMASNRRCDYIFPNRAGTGPLTPARLDDDAAKFTGWWPQDLRRSYATLAVAAGVSDDLVDKMLNHGTEKPITGRYIRTSGLGPTFRERQTTISDFLLNLLREPEPKAVATSLEKWLVQTVPS